MSCSMVDGKVFNPESLEVNVVHHCNLACRACSHLSPVLAPHSVEPEKLHDALSALARSYRAAACKLLGGEPLVHKRLLEVVAAVRASGVAERILVVTNGLLLPRMARDFWEAVDEVHVSHYPGRALDPDEYPRLNALARDCGTRIEASWFDHFRESYAEHGTRSGELVGRIYRTCKVAHVWHCHTVFGETFFRCPQSVFLHLLRHPDGDPAPVDGLPIEISAEFPRRLLDYLRSSRPLAACRRCLGTVGRRLPHALIPRSDWRSVQDRSSEELIDFDFLAALERDPRADEGCVSPACPAARGARH